MTPTPWCPTLSPDEADRLLDLLRSWLPKQRWCPVNSADFQLSGLQSYSLPASVADASTHLVVGVLKLEFTTAEAGPRAVVLQVPLSFRTTVLEAKELLLVGQMDVAGESVFVYDGLADPAFVGAYLDLVRERGSTGSAEGLGPLAGHRIPGAEENESLRIPHATGTVRILSAEQSNTSVIINDGVSAAIIKTFRVLAEGNNPEVEIGAALTGAGVSEVPATLGWIRGTWPRIDAADQPVSVNDSALEPGARGEFAVVHEFLAGGLDAWALTVAAAAAGDPFIAEAEALGAATAEVHKRLAQSLPVAEQGVDVLGPLAERVRASWLEAAGVVGPYGPEVEAVLESLKGVDEQAQRIHGDLHLGQILQLPADPLAGKAQRWAILDFEGEPMRPVSQRSTPDLRLRDVVGMLRSFDYAAGAAERENPAVQVPETWVTNCTDAFMSGYGSVIEGTIDPRSPVFVALWLDKALYEVVYELRNRPGWLGIPVDAVRRALAPSQGSGSER
ncbi:maltokinase N-terminal cap-like domain-containing protein [Pseudarthrobacter sp. J1738]|uniref:maltokinase N-terminal cap-like domain-containing protein n=1 Tax=Pseudarthrobacter sp. J1738 TaxID=3420446 RepID=UPI003D29934D